MADGSKVWVCEKCGHENPALETPVVAAVSTPAQAMATVADDLVAPAPEMTSPMAPVTPTVPPVPVVPTAPAAPVSPLDPTQVQPLT